MTDAQPQAEITPFWRFSLQFYRLTGVAGACIALQDEYGVDVNLLLFLLWRADEGRSLSADEVKALDDKVRDWRNLAVIPIRDTRRKLKSARTLIEPGQQEAFRTKIKAIELEAERLQQQALFALSQSGPLGKEADPRTAAHGNVCAYEHIMGATFPRDTVGVLLGAFNSVVHGERSNASAGAERG
jgi:uncharacterized protein (TIGR02444 family)